MKGSFLILLFCILIIGVLKMTGLLNASPLLIFLGTFGLALIFLVGAMLIAAKTRKGGEHE